MSNSHLLTTASAKGVLVAGSSRAASPYHLAQLHQQVLQEVSGGEALFHHHEVGFIQVLIHGKASSSRV